MIRHINEHFVAEYHVIWRMLVNSSNDGECTVKFTPLRLPRFRVFFTFWTRSWTRHYSSSLASKGSSRSKKVRPCQSCDTF